MFIQGYSVALIWLVSAGIGVLHTNRMKVVSVISNRWWKTPNRPIVWSSNRRFQHISPTFLISISYLFPVQIYCTRLLPWVTFSPLQYWSPVHAHTLPHIRKFPRNPHHHSIISSLAALSWQLYTFPLSLTRQLLRIYSELHSTHAYPPIFLLFARIKRRSSNRNHQTREHCPPTRDRRLRPASSPQGRTTSATACSRPSYPQQAARDTTKNKWYHRSPKDCFPILSNTNRPPCTTPGAWRLSYQLPSSGRLHSTRPYRHVPPVKETGFVETRFVESKRPQICHRTPRKHGASSPETTHPPTQTAPSPLILNRQGHVERSFGRYRVIRHYS